jgi:hypothetical protein
VNDQSADKQEEQSSTGEGTDAGAATEGKSEPTADLVMTPIAVIPAEPVVVEESKVIVVEASTPVAADVALTDKLASILKDVPAAHQPDIARVLTYLERMSPKRPVDTKAGVQEQVALYRSIQNIINRQEQYFTQLFSALLYIFKSEAAGALGDRYRMRFMDNVTLNVGDRKAFAAISQMLAILADPLSRDLALKQVNLERALANGLTAEGRMRVLHYFGV